MQQVFLGGLRLPREVMKDEREKMIRLIRETVQSGGSVFVGEKSLLGQLV